MQDGMIFFHTTVTVEILYNSNTRYLLKVPLLGTVRNSYYTILYQLE